MCVCVSYIVIIYFILMGIIYAKLKIKQMFDL